MTNKKERDSDKNLNPDNEFNNSVSSEPEIEQPNPSTATPSFPQEMPIRQG